MERGSFFLEVTGTDSSTAEIGEQIAWLGSALRPSEEESKLSCYSPFVSEMRVENIQATTADPPIAGYLSCSIDFRLEYYSGFSSNGQCWHHLFRNPTVVMGFPIRRRYQRNTGLEIPLNILAEMAQAYYVDIFDHKLFIKGFSTLLTPVEFNKSQNQILWHLTCNSNGSRISYLDGPVFHTDGIAFADLERSRNILGWCSDASFLAGEP